MGNQEKIDRFHARLAEPDGLLADERAPRERVTFDFCVADHGSILVLAPLNDAAESWIEDHVGYEQTWGDGIVIEPRYFDAIIEGVEAEGFTVR